MSSACLLNGARTPFGNFGGGLKDFHPVELAAFASRAALERAAVAPEKIEECFFGNVLVADSQSIYFARHAALAAGLPVNVPALTVNRLCGSGMEAIGQAANAIALGRMHCALAGGAESMSQAPLLALKARWGQKLGAQSLEDALLGGLSDSRAGMAMGMTAEVLAREFGISRSEQDEFAALSQTRAEEARDRGRLAREIAALAPKRKASEPIRDDEFIRGQNAAARLAELPPAFDPAGTVTAGNASGINDGAAAVVVCSEEFAKKSEVKPLARIVAWSVAACEPERMGIGPALAIPLALQRAQLQLNDIDLFEINEAFAAQFLAVARSLKLPVERCNVNGGAIAIGHPLGASGARIALSLALELQERQVRYGVAALCIGGGQGIAMILERC